MTGPRWRWLGALLPVLGLALLAARGELAQRSGARFRLPIEGYDPRDLLQGHYLQFRYALDWQDQSSCGALENDQPVALQVGCCVCLMRGRRLESSPGATQVACDAVAGCDAWLRSEAVLPPQRYWIPEASASQLEMAFRNSKASLDVTVDSSGGVTPGELYLDRRPWREVLPQ